MSEDQTYKRACQIIELALTKKAQELVLMNLKGLSAITDYFIICHGDSDLHVKAIADAVLNGMKREKIYVWHIEGYEYLNWVLLDYIDIVVHIFQKKTREFYNLERLWGDAEIKEFH